MPRTKRKAIDDHESQFKNSILRVAIAAVHELRKSDPYWMSVDRLDRLGEYEGYYEVVKK